MAEDALQFLERKPARAFDVVFLDPPFASTLLAQALKALPPHLTSDGVVYAECGEVLTIWLANHGFDDWRILKEGRAGQAHFALLSRSNA